MKYRWEVRPKKGRAGEYVLVESETGETFARVYESPDSFDWVATVSGLRGLCSTRIDAMLWATEILRTGQDDVDGWYQ